MALQRKDVVELKRILSIIEENPDELLQEAKKEMEAINSHTSETILHTAIKTGDYNSIKAMLDFFDKHNLNLNVKDRYSWTILHSAVSNSNMESDEPILELILSYKQIEADVVNDNLNTPLHYL